MFRDERQLLDSALRRPEFVNHGTRPGHRAMRTGGIKRGLPFRREGNRNDGRQRITEYPVGAGRDTDATRQSDVLAMADLLVRSGSGQVLAGVDTPARTAYFRLYYSTGLSVLKGSARPVR